MAKQATADAGKRNPILALRGFYRDVKMEMGKVAWPTRDEIKSSTQIVMLLLVLLATIVYGFDFVFKHAVLLILRTLA